MNRASCILLGKVPNRQIFCVSHCKVLIHDLHEQIGICLCPRKFLPVVALRVVLQFPHLPLPIIEASPELHTAVGRVIAFVF